MDPSYFMKQAYREALNAFEADEVPIGAVVVCENRIIARGFNQTEMLIDTTAHAEILALTAAFIHLGSKILDECTLYVTIEPCVMCAGALKWARIGKLVYGADEPKSGFSKFSPSVLHPSTKIEKGLLKDECAALMQDFFRKKRV
ncbi:MAG: nucleoside deaminase [Flavobacteriales bacterium]|nr:nucleoside deaminase [Flavobacteriales bacterium]